jgi:hypothetical protein
MQRGRLHGTGQPRSASCEAIQYPRAAKHGATSRRIHQAQYVASGVREIAQ